LTWVAPDSRLQTVGDGTAPDAAGRRVIAPAMVGRAAELSALSATVSAPPAVVSVEGEARVGKSRLVAELLRGPAVRGRRVLVGRCHPIRESFPLGPVVEALGEIGDGLSGAHLSTVAGALRPLLPELTPWLPPMPVSLDDGVAQRHRVFRGLAEVLAAVSPSVLVLEDLHWMDEQTGDFLTYLLGGVPAGLSVVLTYRGEEAGAALRALTARPPAGTALAHVSLAPLDEAGTGGLAAAILGLEQVSDEFARYLWERTSGLPFAVEEVLALVREVLCDWPERPSGYSCAAPAGPGRYRYEMDVEQDVRAFMTEVHTAWDFDVKFDGPLDDMETLPVVDVRYDVDVDLTNAVTAGKPYTATFTPGYQPGYTGPRGPFRVEAWVSHDDGATWRSSGVDHTRGSGAEFRLLAPRNAEFVTLRVKVTDAAGNSVDQTITRAWQVSRQHHHSQE
jgi:hypothetical protein